jgi:hypothetical protein
MIAAARGRSVRALAALSLVGAVTVMGRASSASADDFSACTPTTGVVVVVDFSAFSGAFESPIQRQCAVQASNAANALTASGFTTVVGKGTGNSELCEIDNLPTAGCKSPSWWFWYAPTGQSSWTFSSSSLAAYRPAGGTVIAFAFGAAKTAPTAMPAALRANAAAPGTSGPTDSSAAASPSSASPSSGSHALSKHSGPPGWVIAVVTVAIVVVGGVSAFEFRRRRRGAGS